jgi:hypothetical protein
MKTKTKLRMMNDEPHCFRGFHGSAISVFCFPFFAPRFLTPDPWFAAPHLTRNYDV